MSERQVSVSRVIPVPPDVIFAVLTDPAQHQAIDGSDSVRAPASDDGEPLTMGSRFGMNMRLGLPYRITSEVVEFEPDRLIAWAHLGKHRWRYELEPVEGGTEVTHTFDWSTARSPRLIELAGYPRKHEANMGRTLERLEAHVTDD